MMLILCKTDIISKNEKMEDHRKKLNIDEQRQFELLHSY